MAASAEVLEEIQKLNPDGLIDFFEINLTAFASMPIIRMVPSAATAGNLISFDSNNYLPTPMRMTGVEEKSGGLPQPTLFIADVDGSIKASCKTHENWAGGLVVRRRTHVKWLGQANPPEHESYEYTIIERLKHPARLGVKFKLASQLERTGKHAPTRTYMKSACGYVYRRWDSAGGYFRQYKCPYTAVGSGKYFKVDGTATADPSLDVCGRTITDCELRYGNKASLPFFAFPGLGRLDHDSA